MKQLYSLITFISIQKKKNKIQYIYIYIYIYIYNFLRLMSPLDKEDNTIKVDKICKLIRI